MDAPRAFGSGTGEEGGPAPPRPLPDDGYYVAIEVEALCDMIENVEPEDHPDLPPDLPWPYDPGDQERPDACQSCDGTGEVQIDTWPGNWYEPPEAIMAPCPDCNSGWSIEVETLDLEEFEKIICCAIEPALA